MLIYRFVYQECNKSICTLIGKAECTLTILNVEDPLRQRGVDREYLCRIGCFDSKIFWLLNPCTCSILIYSSLQEFMH